MKYENEEEKIDELAFKIMRGNYGNGRERKIWKFLLCLLHIYKEEEWIKAQEIVNTTSWSRLLVRHVNRKMIMKNYTTKEKK